MRNNSAVRATSDMPDEPVGLLANGSSGSWDVSIDETISGGQRWFAQIEGPAIYLYFELSSLDIIPQAVRFLSPLAKRRHTPSGSSNRSGELLVSKPGEIPVFLVQDDEFEDRCFVVIGETGRPIMRCSLAGKDARDVAKALRQAEKGLPQRPFATKKANPRV